MIQKALVIAIALFLGIIAYRTYLNVGDKTANWQLETLQLKDRCAFLLEDGTREPKAVAALQRKVRKLAWRSNVSDAVINDLSKAADPIQKDAVGAGIALDHCMRQLEGVA